MASAKHESPATRRCIWRRFSLAGYSPDYDMTLRQVTDGRDILQAVFQGGALKECDLSSDTNQMLDFISSFIMGDREICREDFGDVFVSTSITNYTKHNMSLAHLTFQDATELGELEDYVNMKALRRDCRKFLVKATETAEQEAKSGNFTDLLAEIINTLDPEKLNSYKGILPAPPKETLLTPQDHNLSKRSAAVPVKKNQRSKRGAFDFSSVLIFPGTKWCGKGDLAQCFDDLGDDHELDMCCRDHDCCPFVIPPFTSRHNLFNYRLHSLLHCECDQRFRGCLRQSVSSMANMIGKIYFNILGSKCFTFSEEEVCVERSWWGRCLRYESQQTALLESQVAFNEEHALENVAIDNKTRRK
ncbi:uncharacterized protein LOC127847724 [Dreissena polymorpha]|uniref:phospholipase A2 n=1 Tax=Dreissena polymorpha TaxID=45954 RepID=A0A9D4IA46_DREPO|nr:uncharacterized protein LOC127847724 [Dreissena polymorpha]KAH3752588.1 hypothetical protein DPMN_187209 [Dreissena polymorpha]